MKIDWIRTIIVVSVGGIVGGMLPHIGILMGMMAGLAITLFNQRVLRW